MPSDSLPPGLKRAVVTYAIEAAVSNLSDLAIVSPVVQAVRAAFAGSAHADRSRCLAVSRPVWMLSVSPHRVGAVSLRFLPAPRGAA